MNGYYINLKHREDRNRYFINDVKKYKYFDNIRRYEAVYDKECGAIGCVKSHINVLLLCLEQEFDYYLIMEDDFKIFHEKNLHQFFNSFEEIKNEKWDLITLTPCGTTIDTESFNNYHRIIKTLSTTGYIIRKEKIKELLENFQESLQLLIQTNDVKRYILDKHWFKIQNTVRFYYFKDIFASQLTGYSDIKKDWTFNRDKLFINTDYKKIMFDDNLINLINDPYNDRHNFEMAYSYEDIGQTASALTYYLRCAEFTKNDDLAYECLLRMSVCLGSQGNRDTMELTCIQHAISIRPQRPEANYLMSLYYSYREKWLESYMFACNGLSLVRDPKHLIKDFIYFNEFQLSFQKAYSGYHKGKLKESYEIYLYILENYEVDNFHKKIITNNLNQFPPKFKMYDNLVYDSTIHKVNNYHGEETVHFKLYKKCPISDCIRRGFCWEEHQFDIINNYVKSHFICMEVGSNIGTCSIKLSRCCNTLYCFEPLKESFNLLVENLHMNQCDNVITENCGLSNENKKGYLNFISTGNPGGSGIICESGKPNSDIMELGEEYPIRLITIDSLKLDKLDYLKIDTEGYEQNIIEGGYITIERCKPIIVMEIYEDLINFRKMEISEIKERYKKLIGMGYTVKNIYDYDYLFTQKDEDENINIEIEEVEEEVEVEVEGLEEVEEVEEEVVEVRNKLDIVLQGGYNEDVFSIAEYYLELDFVNHVIISCWEDDDLDEILNNDRINNSGITIIQSKKPLQVGSGNKNLQIISSLNGLKQTDTEFVIKIRNDQRYEHDSMYKMYDFYEEYKERKMKFYYDEKKPRNRICVSGNFAEFSFHPRDHLFWGNREDLIDLFSLPPDTWSITDRIKYIIPEDYAMYYEHFIRSETYIGAHYLANFDRKINYYLLDPKKYLYDNSEGYQETRILSDKLTPQVFKSFPREGIDLQWYKYQWKMYPYESQKERFGERWHEDGL